MDILSQILEKTERKGQCLEWQGYLNKGGYGTVWIKPHISQGKLIKGQHKLVHRVLVEESLNILLESEDKVCHKCDNPKCVNTDHLFIGTQNDNVQDMISKGRKKSKLTKIDIENIRKIKGKTLDQIAYDYGVSPQHISRIKNNQAWKHLENVSQNRKKERRAP